MRVFKKILIGLGAVFLVVVALIAWLGVKSTHFKAQQEPFVRAFVADLSKRWESYYFGTNGNSGVFSYKAIFESGEAMLKVTVVTKDDVSRVQGIYITGVHLVEGRGNARIKT